MFRVLSFYKFIRIGGAIENFAQKILDLSNKHYANGLIIVAPEGINGTVAMPDEMSDSFATELCALSEIGELKFKISSCQFNPFRRMKVRIREEIVSLGKPQYFPSGRCGHVSPDEWNQLLRSGECNCVDVRNWYETKIGMFQGAIDPKTRTFSEFPDFLQRSSLNKNKPLLMYCTGGIRCEKAIYVAKELGFKDVYQLDGGILGYLERYPDGGLFEGECFVFDHRVAVRSDLLPSERYHLCPHCGQPAGRKISCLFCGQNAFVCDACIYVESKRSCSKNCSYHLRMGNRRRRQSSGL